MTRILTSILALFITSPAYAPPPVEVRSPAASRFVAQLRAATPANAETVARMYDMSKADLVDFAAQAAELLRYELRHHPGCRFDSRIPSRQLCACGLNRKIKTLKVWLDKYDRRTP